MQRKKSRLLWTTTRNEDHTMDQNNGLEAKISKEETRTIITMDLGELPLLLIGIFLSDQTSPMGLNIRTMENHVMNAQLSRSIGALEFDLELNFSTNRMGTGKTMGTSLVQHQLNGETFHKIVHAASQQVISLTILLSADLTIKLRLGLHPTNKNFHKTVSRRHLMWFASPPPMIPLINYHMSVR